jgi:class 3 adenylate cyclase
MAKYIRDFNPHSTEIDQTISSLKKTPGTCVFVDIINSTADKYQCSPQSWIRKINNTFNFILFLNDFPDYLVKGIGDELMLYLPEEAMQNCKTFENCFMLLQEIYSTMENLKNHPRKDLFYECKVGVHYCEDVFNITFFEGVNDYYGPDIDMAARLMKKATDEKIIINEPFYLRVMQSISEAGINPDNTFIKNISPPVYDCFKGVPHPVQYREILIASDEE